jgi:hypothetical protein
VPVAARNQCAHNQSGNSSDRREYLFANVGKIQETAVWLLAGRFVIEDRSCSKACGGTAPSPITALRTRWFVPFVATFVISARARVSGAFAVLSNNSPSVALWNLP